MLDRTPTHGIHGRIMPRHAFSLYDAFSENAFGGSQAAVVMDARTIPPERRFTIAKELGYPATGFVDAVEGDVIAAQFFSTVMEQPMCGHGTVCLVTHLVETGVIAATAPSHDLVLKLPKTEAAVAVAPTASGRVEVMLEIAPAAFRPARIDLAELARHLGTDAYILDPALPVEIAEGDFTHLVLPVRDLQSVGQIAPDFTALRQFCLDHEIETVAAFTTETQDPASDLHVRDFCPAVGVAESASAGTTNAALACYLVRHGLFAPNLVHLKKLSDETKEINSPN